MYIFYKMKLFAYIALVSSAIASTPDNVKVKEIVYNGSGCAPGTVAEISDSTSFTLIYSNFIAFSGPNVNAGENRKNCQINVKLSYPQGWSYAISTVDFTGFISIPHGISAIQKTTFYTSGEIDDASAAARFIGPVTRDYVVRNAITADALIWSPCGADVNTNINAQVRLEGDLSKSAQITVDSTDGKVKQIYGLQWRRC
jgi:hypothetical protein